jgi:RNA polymerase sigma factor (sigma-70 family)
MTAQQDALAARFEEQRGRLRSVAYRMLGSLSEADDAVQEAWLRLSRSGGEGGERVDNLAGWLTTVVGRVCLDVLRTRTRRAEDLIGEPVPDPVAGRDGAADPQAEALLADSVGLALLVVLETLGPAERLAFVLHDMFGVPFEEIAPLVDRTPAAARQLASRARRRVRGESAAPEPDRDHGRQRAVVDAFLAASRDGDFEALLAVLDPDVVLRADTGAGLPGPIRVVRGAREVAGQALAFRSMAMFARPALVDGSVGLVSAPGGRPAVVMGLTVAGGRVVALDIVADPVRLGGTRPAYLDG